jgi:hypothetical protein
MPDQRCIYCSPNKPSLESHNREHVIPEAFGLFKNNLVLNEGVCSKCNGFFGRTIDRFLGRGSVEAVRRLDYRLKPPEEAGDILKDRVRFALSADNQFNGLIMEYANEDGELVVLLVPQVGFPKCNGDGWVYVAESDLEDVAKPLPEGIDTKSSNILVFNSERMKRRLNYLLANRGIEYQEESEEGKLPTQVGQDVLVEVSAVLDDMNLRCIAKIAFNYLAKIAGIDFVVKREMDPIRSYIRYGKKPGYEAVTIKGDPILAFDSIRLRQTNGHLLTLDWSADGRNLIGQVSLFNFTAYRVVLLRNFSGIWRPIRSGHHFNIDSKEVHQLLGISKNLVA